MEPPAIAPRTTLRLDSRLPGAAPARVVPAAAIGTAHYGTPQDQPRQAFVAVVRSNLLAMPWNHARVMSAGGGLETIDMSEQGIGQAPCPPPGFGALRLCASKENYGGVREEEDAAASSSGLGGETLGASVRTAPGGEMSSNQNRCPSRVGGLRGQDRHNHP